MKNKPLILAALILLLVPIRTTTVPEWRIRYIDAKGQPISGLPVRQTWQNYSAELTENMETPVCRVPRKPESSSMTSACETQFEGKS